MTFTTASRVGGAGVGCCWVGCRCGSLDLLFGQRRSGWLVCEREFDVNPTMLRRPRPCAASARGPQCRWVCRCEGPGLGSWLGRALALRGVPSKMAGHGFLTVIAACTAGTAPGRPSVQGCWSRRPRSCCQGGARPPPGPGAFYFQGLFDWKWERLCEVTPCCESRGLGQQGSGATGVDQWRWEQVDRTAPDLRAHVVVVWRPHAGSAVVTPLPPVSMPPTPPGTHGLRLVAGAPGAAQLAPCGGGRRRRGRAGPRDEEGVL